ncbi:MAG: tyrosine-type recombinase/integrase [Actinobacteria bacterium]|nr:tyrosine-type recombinase/integrase [Actinomycetota bacterium]
MAEVLEPERLVFVDEMGLHTSLAPLYGYAPKGERLRLSVPRNRAKTRGEVSEKLTKAMADRDGGLIFEGEERTLAVYLDLWLDGSVKGSVKPSTYESYERVIRCHLKPGLGRRKLKTLAPDHVQHLYRAKLDAGLAPGTVRLMHAVLNRALDQAVRWGVVGRNVCKATTPPQPNPEEIKPLDAESAKLLLKAARGDRLEALYVLAVTAGLRIGELLGLRWEDLDWDASVLRVKLLSAEVPQGRPER